MIKKNQEFDTGRKLVKHMHIHQEGSCGFHCIKIKNFAVRIGDTQILENINLHIHCGQLTAIIGKNGAGKTTLIKAILDEIPHEGTIEFKDTKNDVFQDLRIGYVPQHLNIAKNTPTSVYDLIACYISKVPVFFRKSSKVYRKIKEHLRMFEAEELIDKQVCDLSGGELQRVLLSLATISTPNLLILDEPVSGIDHNGMELFYKHVEYLRKHCDLAILLVSHDLKYVREHADYVVLVEKDIRKEGTPKEVYASQEFKAIYNYETEDSDTNGKVEE